MTISNREKITCIGAGTIGMSWAVLFARAGYQVALYDPSAQAIETALASAACGTAACYAPNIEGTTDLGQALSNSLYVQESIPENLGFKHELFKKLDAFAGPDTLFGSSTSTLPGSAFLTGLSISPRSLVVHPTNPPHVVPLTELCRTSETSTESYDRVRDLMLACGQVPVEILEEIFGFALNRLQAALVAEALDLVSRNIISPTDLDLVVTAGLGLRWALMGPFETGHLNAPGGYYDYMTKFRGTYDALFNALERPTAVDETVIKRVDAALRVHLVGDVATRQLRRDRLLDRISAVLREDD